MVDTGVDAALPSFRGRVAPGTDIFTGGLGNLDTRGQHDAARRPAARRRRRRRRHGAPAAASLLANTIDGHGTPVAGVIAQFVPQATIVPVNIFVPYRRVP